MFNLLSVVLVLFAPLAPQLQRRTCDHAIPPEGMHYVCARADSCDCHLEKDEPESDETAGKPSRMPIVEPCTSSTLRYFVAPDYPETARRSRKQGVVRAHLTVDASGTAAIKIDSGDPVLADQVATTLKKWKFAPADPPQTLAVTFTFALAGDPTENAVTTVSGSSPLDLVVTVSPAVR